MKENISTRLKQIMSERNLKQIDILNMSKPYQKQLDIKMGKSTLSQYVNNVQSADNHRIYLLSKTLGVSEPWLMGYDVPREVEQTESSPNIHPVTKFVNVPVLGRIACGDPIDAEQNVSEYRPVAADHAPNGELFFVEAAGDSMEPKIPDGSYVLCRKQEDVETGEIAAVLVNGDEETTLKKVIKQGDTVLLQPINEAYAPYIITKDNPGRIVGKAISVEMML